MSNLIDTAKKEYQLNSIRYAYWATHLIVELKHMLANISSIDQIQYRIKAWESVETKLKHAKFDKLNDINDLVGIRITLKKQDEIESVFKILFQNFVIERTTNFVWADNKNYQSHHAIISEIPTKTNFPGLKAEIQVKTTLAEVLSTLDHDLKYYQSESATTKIKIAFNKTHNLEKSLDEFIRLLDKPNVHEKADIHSFLDKQRYILSPYADLILSEQQIGIGKQFQIDFLIRRPIGAYVLVEIENPKHKLFTKSGALTSATSHALGQIEDWQEWIEDNLPSVQKKYPDISSPEGILIIGRAATLGAEDRKKLNRKNINSRGRITILTYDDLITDARAYIKSINDNLKNQ